MSNQETGTPISLCVSDEQLKRDCIELAKAGDARAKATLRLFERLELATTALAIHMGIIEQAKDILNSVERVEGRMATVASDRPTFTELSNELAASVAGAKQAAADNTVAQKGLSDQIAALQGVAKSQEAKDLVSAAAKLEAGQKPEEIPELKGIDPKVFEADTSKPAGHRSPDSKRSGV